MLYGEQVSSCLLGEESAGRQLVAVRLIVPPRVARERVNRMLARRLMIPLRVVQERADEGMGVLSTALG